jgi:hypothetical protein
LLNHASALCRACHFSLLLTGCGDSFTPVDLYMAKTPECRDWQEGSRYNLPRGVSISTTSPQVQADGGAEFTFVYLVPRGERACS